jgi:hypothetical protein
MSVIGRLDEQVDAVLISPIGKKRDAPEPSPKPATEEANTRRDEESSAEENETAARTVELPVWLL